MTNKFSANPTAGHSLRRSQEGGYSPFGLIPHQVGQDGGEGGGDEGRTGGIRRGETGYRAGTG